MIGLGPSMGAMRRLIPSMGMQGVVGMNQNPQMGMNPQMQGMGGMGPSADLLRKIMMMRSSQNLGPQSPQLQQNTTMPVGPPPGMMGNFAGGPSADYVMGGGPEMRR